MLPNFVELAVTSAQWVFALSLGETWVHDTDSGEPFVLNVTPELAAGLVDNTKAILSSFDASAGLTQSDPVRLPVLALHNPYAGEFGHIHDVELRLHGFKRGVWLKTTWNSRFEPDRFSHLSVGIDAEFTVQSGEKFGPCIAELSLCTTPKDQRIGSLNEAIAARLAHAFGLATTTEEHMDPEQIQELITNGITEALEPIVERLDAIEADAPEPEEDGDGGDGDDGMPDDSDGGDDATLAHVLAELRDMKAQNVALAKEVQRIEQGGAGRKPKDELPDNPVEAQEALKAKEIRGKANVVAALALANN